MIDNSISIYYDQDNILGDYFQQCGLKTEYLLNLYPGVSQTTITGDNCNSVYVNDVELPKHNSPTLLIIYSHGDRKEFSKNNDPPFFGNYSDKPLCLENGVVYSNACLVGAEFGEKLGSDNASFFGYNKIVSIDINYQRDFIECDVHGLHHILRGKTLIEAKEEAIIKFNDKISQVPMFAASYLRQARDCIVIHGDTSTAFF